MSTKNWKDKELNTLLLEKWGFKFDPDGLTEDEGAAGGELEPDEAEEEEDTGKKKGDRPYVSKEEEELHESWADAPEEQEGGAWGMGRGGGWTSETHPGGGKRYSGGGSSTEQECKDMGCPGTHDTWWQNPERIKAAMPDCDIDMCNPDALRENAGDLYEKHARDWGDKAGDEGSEATDHEHDTDYSGHGMRAGDESDTHPGKDFEHHDTKEGSDEDPKDLAGELLDLAHRFGSAVGVESDVSDDDDEMMDIEVEEEEELEEISKRKDDPRNARAKEWPDRMREALKRQNVKLTEAQTKAIIQRATKIYRNRKR